MKLRVKFPLMVGLVVAATFGLTGYLTYSFQHDLVIGQAERQARMLSRQILLTRRWVTDHDGLFVTKKPGAGGSPAPTAGDVVDQFGQVYEKRNPGMIIWDLSDYAAQADFCRFRVTSLRPVDPANAPDDFERRGLLDFETGKQEVSEIIRGKQGRTLRYMIPLKVEESCLPCHAEHGYQVGNIRGGLSLEVPLGWADEAIAANNRLLLLVALGSVALATLASFLLINSLVVRRLDGLGDGLECYPHPVVPGVLPGGSDKVGELSSRFTVMDERLRGSQAELLLVMDQLYQQELQTALGELAASVAHEIDSPVASMRDSLKNMKDAPDDREVRERCLDALNHGLVCIAKLPRSPLNFCREIPLKAESVAVDVLIRNCIVLLALQLSGIRMKFDLAAPGRYLLDGGILKQALVNITLNAISAMSRGGDILLASRAEPGVLVITLRNSGPGIPPGKPARGREKFSDTTTEGTGICINLSVAYSLVKRLGGHLRVESRPGEGTLFTIELPGAAVQIEQGST